jgi:hypothetical protein
MVSRFLTTLWVASFLAFGGCESTPREPARYSSLTPGPVIRGGLLGTAGPFTPLRGPVAVAAMGPDVYVADAGLGMLLRADQVANRLTPFGPRGVQPGTRLAAAVDGSLYVLEPAGRRLQRFARDGRLLQTFPVDPTIASLRDLALDPARGRILGADALNRQLVAFRPLGTSSELLPLHGEPRYQVASFDALAFDGQVLATFGHERLVKPERIAADRYGRLFVADGGDRTIKAFRDGTLEETIPNASLGLLEATDLIHADGWLYVADAPGSQVRMLRVQPPPKAQQP